MSTRSFVLGAIKLLLLLAPLALPFTPSIAGAQSAPSKIAPALSAQMTATPLKRIPVIVTMNHAPYPFAAPANLGLVQQAINILSTNGIAVGGLPIINGAAGWATPAAIEAISQVPQVATISLDAVVRPNRPPGSSPSTASNVYSWFYPREVHANRVWQSGGSGRGVTVAVLDSGIAPDADLTQAGNRILASVGFAGPRDPQQPDPGGHGSHVAGSIAGDGTRSGGAITGIAPHANVIDVNVLDKNGNGRISSLVAGFGWVIAHQSQYNIRIVNLSLGTPALAPYQADPLATAVEVAWRHGLVVVCAAGNGGPNSGTVLSPGVDPHVITVGSTDDGGIQTVSGQTLAWYSAWGTPELSAARPDLSAPGRRLVSIRVPGSTLDTMLPDHVVTAPNGSSYFRMSGTSMATGVVSGAAALILERQPRLTPDQVKRLLVTTAQPFGQSAPPPPAGAAGAGLLDAYAATNASAPGSAAQGWRPADGFAQTAYPALYGRSSLVWKNPLYQGLNWLAFAWDNIAWDNIAWDNIAWDNIAWDNIAWDNIAWD